jgi:hypothetical protein
MEPRREEGCRRYSLFVELRPPPPSWSTSRWSRGRPEEGEADEEET